MKKLLLAVIASLFLTNVFAEVRITTNQVETGVHYITDTEVNVRTEPSFSAEKIGKINTGDKIKVVKKTDIYKVSGGIYDCFYEVESDVGKGYVFGAYISDNTETLVFEGNKQVYFDKLHNYTIKIPTKIDAVDFFILGHSKQEFLFKFYYFSEKDDAYLYDKNLKQNPTFADYLQISSYLNGIGKDFFEKTYSKAMLFTIKDSEVKNKNFVYSKISEVKVLKNDFTNASFISLKYLQNDDSEEIDATEIVTFYNGEFVPQKLGQDYLTNYQKKSKSKSVLKKEIQLILPKDKGGKKDTIMAIVKIKDGDEVLEEHNLNLLWNGKEFIEEPKE